MMDTCIDYLLFIYYLYIYTDYSDYWCCTSINRRRLVSVKSIKYNLYIVVGQRECIPDTMYKFNDVYMMNRTNIGTLQRVEHINNNTIYIMNERMV